MTPAPFAGAGFFAPSVPSAPSAAVINYQVLIEMLGISPRYQGFLTELGQRQVVIIADDSGSMTTVESIKDGKQHTRWNDLIEMMTLVMRGSAVFNPAGIDVHFLNRGSIVNMTTPEQFVQYGPTGGIIDYTAPPRPEQGTPLVTKLSHVMERYRAYDKPILLIVATDGQPSEGDEAFSALMRTRESDPVLREKFAISFLMCTNDHKVVDFYDEMKDKKGYHGIEVTEAYEAERKEIEEEYKKGIGSFSRGDHVVKMLLGPVIPIIAEMDQPPPSGCCSVM